MVLGVLVSALLARVLSPQDLGQYYLAVTVVTFAGLAGMLGMAQIAVREVARSAAQRDAAGLRHSLTAIMTFVSIGTLLVVTIIRAAADRVLGDTFSAPTLVASSSLLVAWIVLNVAQRMGTEILRGFKNIAAATILGGLLTNLVVVGGLATFRKAGEHQLPSVMALMVFALGLSATIATLILARTMIGLSRSRAVKSGLQQNTWARVATAAIPLLIVSITNFAMTQADTWVLATFESTHDVALYGSAARIALLVAVPHVVVTSVLPPYITELHVQGHVFYLGRLLRAFAGLAAIPATIAAIVFILWGHHTLAIVFGPDFSGASVILGILSLGQLSNVVTGMCGLTLILTGHHRDVMWIALAVSGVTLTLAAFATPSGGPEALATVMSAGVVVHNLALWWTARRRLGIWTHASLNWSVLQALRAKVDS